MPAIGWALSLGEARFKLIVRTFPRMMSKVQEIGRFELQIECFLNRPGTSRGSSLEDFCGFVRQNAHADDRSVTALRIISRTAVVTGLIHDMKLNIVHRSRDNVGEVVIGDYPLKSLQPAQNEARLLANSFIDMAELDFDTTPREMLVFLLTR
jgi:hypothetical protein